MYLEIVPHSCALFKQTCSLTPDAAVLDAQTPKFVYFTAHAISAAVGGNQMARFHRKCLMTSIQESLFTSGFLATAGLTGTDGIDTYG